MNFPSPLELPQGENVIFPESCYFSGSQNHTQLPSPAKVLEESSKQASTRNLLYPKPVKFHSLGLLVKFGPERTIAEGQCLWAIRKAFGNAVPVPEIFGWCVAEGQTFLYMQLIEGSLLKDLWLNLDNEQKQAICIELREIISVWRKAGQEPGSEYIGTVDRKPIRDDIFRQSFNLVPCTFPTISSFNDWFTTIVARRRMSHKPPSSHPYRNEIPDDGAITFTHGDLHGGNIILSNEGYPRILAIIDWDFAGWYPPYWESCKTSSRRCDFGEDWHSTYVPMIVKDLPWTLYWVYFVRSLGV